MPLLENKGGVSHQQMAEHARKEYEHFDVRRKKYDAEQSDAQDMEELKQLEQTIKQEYGN